MNLHPGRNVHSTQARPRAGLPALGFVLSTVLAALTCARQPAFAARAIVTDQGPLKGLAVLGELEYLGIPYASPPVGSLRWLPPQPPARFRGLFQATQFGNICTQLQNGVGPVVGSEDCLYLNVYVPDADPPAHGFPVMVWIHGGSLTIGAGSQYDPTSLVEKGNVIVVTINYRLGFLGFFAHPAIDAEGHLNANYGLMDQQFALKWVKRNIEAFGGDDKRLTIFGESAGGQSVLANLASPTAAGLFRRAISESGAGAHFQDYFNFAVPLATAETVGTPAVPAGITIAAKVGCGSDSSSQTAQCLRAVPASTLVEAEPGNVFEIIDGTVLPQTMDQAFSSGTFNHVPIINGTNHDEYRLFVALQYDLSGHPLTDAEYPAAVAALVGQPASSPFVQFLVNTEYPLSNYPPPSGFSVSAPLALGALGTDFVFVCTARKADLSLSKYVPTYTYEFNDETAPSPLPPLTFPLGAGHAVELEYLFDRTLFGISPTLMPDQQQLSDTMIGYWTNFAKTGDPNFEGAANWPLYTGAGGEFLSLVAPMPPNDSTEPDSSFNSFHNCSSFWDSPPGQ
jgi:para-nitrobenzyl esterase